MIDAGSQEWPPAVTNALPAFRQGTLVPRPPFAYHSNTTLPLWLASTLAEEKGADVSVEVELEDRPPYGIITSQSCDVDEEGINQKPWIQVAPVYELPEGYLNLNLVQQWRVSYLLPVPALGPRWTGDLRIEMPIEKSWLVGQDHLDAYDNQEDFDKMGNHVAAYRGRSAMATSVYDLVLKPLAAYLAAKRKDDPPFHELFHQRVTDIFVELAGDALQPSAVRVIFVSDLPWPETISEALDDWWEDACAELTEPFVAVANLYRISGEVTLSDLRRWIPQDIARIAGS